MKVEIEIPEEKEAKWINGVLTLVDEKPKDITDRIKTFTDACSALGDNYPLVSQYYRAVAAFKYEPMTEDLLAYLKLRIICKALNEGWRPAFTEDECRYYPWFRINTPEEYKELSTSEKKECCVFFQSGNNECSGSIVYVNSYYAGSVSSGYNGGSNWLALKTKELAEYCGKQFIDIWISYLFDSNI